MNEDNHGRIVKRPEVILQEQWERCQSGILRCKKMPSDRTQMLNRLDDREGNPLSYDWSEILRGNRPDLEQTLLHNDVFPKGDGYWRQMVSSSPFAFLK